MVFDAMLERLFKAVRQAGREFLQDDCLSSAAASAYYSIFSLPPLIIIVFVLASYAGVSRQQVDSVVELQVGIPIGGMDHADSDAKTSAASDNEQTNPKTLAPFDRGAQSIDVTGIGTLDRFLGIAILIFTATGLFAQLQYSLNRAWDVQPDPRKGGVKPFIFKRVVSLGFILVLAFLLLVSLIISTLIDQFIEYLQGATPYTLVWILTVTLNNLLTFGLARIFHTTLLRA